MRYFIHLGYEGTSYRGWQRQKDVRETLQETVETALTQIFKKPMSVYGCGRTDAGVHASQYVIQIDVEKAPTFDLKFRMNKNLPDDIAVFEVFEVKHNQNCRYDAEKRTYDYFMHWKKDPGLMRFSSLYDDLTLDFGLMKKATELILITKDFKSMCKQPDSYDNTLCLITECKILVDQERGRLRFSITGNRFLRGMVRICVFFILKVGTGEMTLDEFEAVLTQKKEFKEKWPAHPNGLFLSRIEYPFLELTDSHNLIKMLKLGLE